MIIFRNPSAFASYSLAPLQCCDVPQRIKMTASETFHSDALLWKRKQGACETSQGISSLFLRESMTSSSTFFETEVGLSAAKASSIASGDFALALRSEVSIVSLPNSESRSNRLQASSSRRFADSGIGFEWKNPNQSQKLFPKSEFLKIQLRGQFCL